VARSEEAVGSDRVAEAFRRAEAVYERGQFGGLPDLIGHVDARQRLLALALMRREIAKGASAIEFLPLARTLVEDPDSDCRWQALIVIGECLTTNPEEVWQVIRAHGGSEDQDLRMGVATLLLEQLLEDHFDEYFAKVRQEMLRGSARFADTVASCWFDGCQGPRYHRVQMLLRNAARGGFRKE
jgi:hypothetical protein